MTARICFILVAVFLGNAVNADVKPWDDAFKQQWYAGLAELTRYELKQARYGDVHQGDAVLIFVTEDFLTGPQVKRERGDEPATSVLKLNFTRTFTTGIYPYSLLTSVFTPVAPGQNHTLKVSTTVQEWCGHTFMQLNRRQGHYEGILRSYFQNEADRDFDLPDVLLEDEVWTRLRLSPGDLPTGEIKIIPGTQFQRLVHILPDVHAATAEMIVQDTTQTYRLTYTSLSRKLDITFKKDYPHAIVRWEEAYQQRDRWLTTTAVKTHSVMLDYWAKHGVADSTYRAQLGLE